MTKDFIVTKGVLISHHKPIKTNLTEDLTLKISLTVCPGNFFTEKNFLYNELPRDLYRVRSAIFWRFVCQNIIIVTYSQISFEQVVNFVSEYERESNEFQPY